MTWPRTGFGFTLPGHDRDGLVGGQISSPKARSGSLSQQQKKKKKMRERRCLGRSPARLARTAKPPLRPIPSSRGPSSAVPPNGKYACSDIVHGWWNAFPCTPLPFSTPTPPRRVRCRRPTPPVRGDRRPAVASAPLPPPPPQVNPGARPPACLPSVWLPPWAVALSRVENRLV